MQPGMVEAYEKQDWDRLRFIVGKLYKEWNTTQYYSLTKSLKTMSKCITQFLENQETNFEKGSKYAMVLAYGKLNYEINQILKP